MPFEMVCGGTFRFQFTVRKRKAPHRCWSRNGAGREPVIAGDVEDGGILTSYEGNPFACVGVPGPEF